MQTKPIETAPKTRQILLYVPRYDRWFIGHWNPQPRHKRPHLYWDYYTHASICREYPPSNWAELPPKPKKGAPDDPTP
jgi:hypothetical protein